MPPVRACTDVLEIAGDEIDAGVLVRAKWLPTSGGSSAVAAKGGEGALRGRPSHDNEMRLGVGRVSEEHVGLEVLRGRDHVHPLRVTVPGKRLSSSHVLSEIEGVILVLAAHDERAARIEFTHLP